MDQETLQRILELVGKTGDRVIVTDPAGKAPFVVMGLDQYEQLVGGADVSSETPKAEPPKRRPALRVEEDIDPPVSLKGMTSYKGEKKDIPLWKSQPKQEASPKESQEAPKETPKEEPKASSQGGDAGEEQFYLEPLE